MISLLVNPFASRSFSSRALISNVIYWARCRRWVGDQHKRRRFGPISEHDKLHFLPLEEMRIAANRPPETLNYHFTLCLCFNLQLLSKHCNIINVKSGRDLSPSVPGRCLTYVLHKINFSFMGKSLFMNFSWDLKFKILLILCWLKSANQHQMM
jgi:hypothetical protein